MIQKISFDEVVSKVAGATKNNQKKFYHTWDGWMSKDVLHVTSASGARRRKIWHFPLEKNVGRNMFFKNTTGTADCWTMSAGKNELEKFVLAMNPLAKIEYVDEINHLLYQRGSQCSHSTSSGGNWWYITTDGQQEVVHKAEAVEYHSNQFHRGCPTGPDDVLVTGGTFAVNWSNKHQFCRVYIARGANVESIILQIEVQKDLWRMLDHSNALRDPWWDDNLTIDDFKNHRLELLELAAEGKLLPEFVERLTNSVKPYQNLTEGVSHELYNRALVHHPDSILRRELTDEIVSLISDKVKFDFFLTNQGEGEVIILLPKDEEFWWEKKWEKEGSSGSFLNKKLMHWMGNKSPAEQLEILPKWAVKNIVTQCDATPLCDLRNVAENIFTARDLAIKIEREIDSSRPGNLVWRKENGIVFLKDGQNPNQGFSRVHWNPWYKK